MEQMVIKGGGALRGKVRISGSKNASLPIMAAALLSSERIILEDVSALEDVKTMIALLRHLGTEVHFDESRERLSVLAQELKKFTTPYELVGRMRASILVMGPLLGRYGRARISQPGGCAIGLRPIDLHIKGMVSLGAEITVGHGYLEVRAKKLCGSKIYLDYPSVGATENIIMAAVLAAGTTVVENAAQEPEVVDLANFLNTLGAKVNGAGTSVVRIQGVKALHGGCHQIIPDRIEAGTFMLAAVITRGEILLENVIADHLKPVFAKLRETGTEILESDAGITVSVPHEVKAVDIKTLPYPGFPTDLQPQFMALMATAQGNSVTKETVFENRFMHVPELRRMGADIRIEGYSALIKGADCLKGATVRAPDLCGAAALVLAGLAAQGSSSIRGLYHLDRGYNNFSNKLRAIGASLSREQVGNEVKR